MSNDSAQEAIVFANGLLDSGQVSADEVLEQAEGRFAEGASDSGSVLIQVAELHDFEAHDVERNRKALFREAVKRTIGAEREAQREDDIHLHYAFRPEVVAEVAVQLTGEADWEALAEMVDGWLNTGADLSGEYHSVIEVPGAGAAGEGEWIIKRHDGSWAVRHHIEEPSEDSIAIIKAQALCQEADRLEGMTAGYISPNPQLEAGRQIIAQMREQADRLGGTPGDEVYEDIAKAREAAVLRKHIAELERDAELDQIDPGREWPIVLLKERAAKLEENNPMAGMPGSYWEGGRR